MARSKVTCGVATPLPAVFDKKNMVDGEALKILLRHMITNRIHGVLVNGAAGEWPALTIDERKRIAEVAAKEVKGRMNIVVHTGSTRIEETIELTRHAKSLGVDAVMVVAPVINRIQQDDAYEYFRTVAKAVDVPLIAYDNPGSAGVSILPDTMRRISEIENVIGLKDSGRDIRKTSDIIERVGKKMDVMTGEPDMFLATLALGGTGGMLCPPLIAPKLGLEVYTAFVKGDLRKSRNAH